MSVLELNLDDYYADLDGTYNASCYQYRNDKEYHIMKNFLQPDSTMCLQDAAESRLENCSSGAIVSMIHLCANVIPWHHTSHLKLAWLAERLHGPRRCHGHLDMIKVRTPSLRRMSFGASAHNLKGCERLVPDDDVLLRRIMGRLQQRG
jgi:hypothetical protein